MSTSKYIMLFLALLFVTSAGDFVLDHWHYKEGDHRRLQKEIDRKIKRTDRIFERLKSNDWQLDTPLPKNTGIVFLVYRNDSLKYWSDNTFSFNTFNQNALADKRFDFISNGWYIVKSYTTDSVRAYGLILVKTQYPYENDFLINKFQPDLKLPASTELLTEPQPGSYSIIDWEGIYLFSIKFNMDELRFSRLEKNLSPFLIFLTLFSFLIMLHRLIQSITRSKIRNAVILVLPVLLFLLRGLQYRFHIPVDLYNLEFFGPIPFAKSAWLPSLGDVLLNSLLILFVVIEFFLEFTLHIKVYSGKTFRSTAIITLLLILLTGFFIYCHLIISNLVLHSIISFEFFKAASLDIYTMTGLLIMAMHFAAILFIAHKLLALCKLRCNLKRLIVIFMLVTTTTWVISLLWGYRIDTLSVVSYVLIFCTLAVMQYKKVPLGNYTAMTLMVVLFSAFTVYITTFNDNKKTGSNMMVMAENLAAQHDPIAEYLLEDISRKLSKDQTLNSYMFNWTISTEQIHKYLQTNYFNGFWGKYKLWIKDCSPITEEYFDNDTVTVCYDYYMNRMEEGKSMQLPGTLFYFLDSQNGRINYLGWITYRRPGRKAEVSLFIELESRLVAEELGFPELLLDKRYEKNSMLENYSYAKYYKNQLLAQSGTFQYSLDLNTYKNQSEKFGGYKHFISDLSKDNVVIVSKPRTTFFNKLVSFSYIFIFYYIIILIFIVFRDFSKLGRDIEFNFKNKIQLSINAVIFLSLFLVGGGTIYLSIQQYQRKQHDILSEKIQSVYIELDHLLAYLPTRISPDWKGDDYENLNQLLIKFSDVFYSDINLYDPQGNLLATSRSDIFEEGLAGEKMDPMAYDKMVNGKQAEFIHREKIGNLSFLSAYVPFVNTDNKLLAFLNLPYFTRQNVLRNEITTLVVAIVNIYVLLILLTIALSAIISDQITRPLRMIQQKFSQIKIGKKSEEIVYKGHDEIAGLVDEYNRMVKELVKSVEMLSRSERESAWREMAKQVAHEIKNPLTPMKLSVQHLRRTWNDNKENFDEYLEKVTRTLIEQIDNLSFIASEFSNFAKMPKAFNEEINIVESIRSTLTLFSNIENVDFVFEHESEKILVFADKEQLSRVFINLLKNAIQSIPDNRGGKIVIGLVMNGSMVRVSLTDNGKGIPEELQGKLFTPSFTTKSSGMGMGLSIVKSIIESFGGIITFKTKVNHGTTFLIELPVYRKSEPEGRNN
jgi:two-component system, NtrC family, nitrogen regulation sensor histidine kinase NtrY